TARARARRSCHRFAGKAADGHTARRQVQRACRAAAGGGEGRQHHGSLLAPCVADGRARTHGAVPALMSMQAMQSWWMQMSESEPVLEVRETPLPQPGPGQLLVRMHAAA